MKVQIESTPKYLEYFPEPLMILNGIIDVAIKSESLKDLENMLENTDTDGYIYGFGSSHCWIKQESNNGRILFITEYK